MAAKVEVVFTGDTKNLDGAWKKAKGGAQGFGGELDKTGGKLSKFKGGALGHLKGFAGGVAAAFTVDKLISFGGEMFSLGQDIKAYQLRAETVFGDALGTVKTFADGINESMGMGENAVLGLAAGLGDLLVPMGFTRQAAAEMSTQALQMGTALAVAAGKPIEEGINAIASAMVGERESLKSLGIVVSEQTIKNALMAKGLGHLTGEARRQAEAQILLEEVNRQSADAQAVYNQRVKDGDLASQGLSAMFADMKEKLAVWLTPALEDAAKWVTDVGTAMFGTEEETAGLSDSAKDAADTIKELVGQLKAAVEFLGKVYDMGQKAAGVLDSISGGINKAGGWVNRLLGGDGKGDGGGLSKGPGKRHSGGPVDAGVPYIVGRTGAEEMFVPDSAGTILAGRMMRGGGGGGGGGPIHITLTVDGRELARVVAKHNGQRDYVSGAS